MWHTSRGDRTLRGKEAALIKDAIDSMVDSLLIHIDEDIDEDATACESGIALYDAFSASQRIGLLHDVAAHLLTDTSQALPLSAALDATVAAIFVDIRDQVAIEIDFPSINQDSFGNPSDTQPPTWRQRVLASYQAMLGAAEESAAEESAAEESAGEESYGESEDPHQDLPDPSCTAIQRWDELVERLADAILWDRDFELAESFLDADPSVSQQRRRLLGIDDDYFTRVAPDPRGEELDRLISRTRDIVRRKPR